MRLLATLLLAYGIITVAQAFGVHFIANTSTKADNQEGLNGIQQENDAASPVPSQQAESGRVTTESASATKTVTPLTDGAIEGPPTEQAVTILATEAITDAIPASKIAETESVAATGTQAGTLAGLEQNSEEQGTMKVPQTSPISSAPFQSDSIITHTTIDSSTQPPPGPSRTSTTEAGAAESESCTSQVTSHTVVTESKKAVAGTGSTSPPTLSSGESTIVSNPVQSETQTSTHPSGHNDASHKPEQAEQLSTQPGMHMPLSPDNIQRSTAAFTTGYTAGAVGEPGNSLETKPSDNISQNEAQNHNAKISTGKPTSADLSVPQGSSHGRESTPNSDAKAAIDKSSPGTELAENSSGNSGKKNQNHVGSTGSSQAQKAHPRVGTDSAQDESGGGSANGSPSMPNQNRDQTQGTKSLGEKPTSSHSSALLDANTPSTSNERLNLVEGKVGSGASLKGKKSKKSTSGSNGSTGLASVKDQEGSSPLEPSLDDNHPVVTRIHDSSETGSDESELAQHYEDPQAFVDETKRSVSTKKAGNKTRKRDSSMSNSSSSRRRAHSREVARHLSDDKRASQHSQSAERFKTAQSSSESGLSHSSDFGSTGLDTRTSGSEFHSFSNSTLSAHAISGLDQIMHPLLPDNEDFEDSDDDDDDDTDGLSDDDDDDEEKDIKKKRVKKVLTKEPNKEKGDDDNTDEENNPLVEDSDDDEDDEDQVEAKLPSKNNKEDDDDEEEKREKSKLSSKKELKYGANNKRVGHSAKGASSPK